MLVPCVPERDQRLEVHVTAEDFKPSKIILKRIFLAHKETSTDLGKKCCQKCHRADKKTGEEKEYQNHGTGSHRNIKSANRKVSTEELGLDIGTQVENKSKTKLQDASVQNLESSEGPKKNIKSHDDQGTGSRNNIQSANRKVSTEELGLDISTQIENKSKPKVQDTSIQSLDSPEGPKKNIKPHDDQGTGSRNNIKSANRKISTEELGLDSSIQVENKSKTKDHDAFVQSLDSSEDPKKNITSRDGHRTGLDNSTQVENEPQRKTKNASIQSSRSSKDSSQYFADSSQDSDSKGTNGWKDSKKRSKPFDSHRSESHDNNNVTDKEVLAEEPYKINGAQNIENTNDSFCGSMSCLNIEIGKAKRTQTENIFEPKNQENPNKCEYCGQRNRKRKNDFCSCCIQTENEIKSKIREHSVQCDCDERGEGRKDSQQEFCCCSRVRSFCNVNSIVIHGSSQCICRKLHQKKPRKDRKNVSVKKKTVASKPNDLLQQLREQSNDLKEIRSLIEQNILQKKTASAKKPKH